MKQPNKSKKSKKSKKAVINDGKTEITWSDVSKPKRMYKAIMPKSLGGSGKKGYYKGGGTIQHD